MGKLRIEVSCTEDNLTDALYEAKAIMNATDILCLEIKVFHSINREQSKGHSYISLPKNSDPLDRLKIYELEKQLEGVIDQLDKTSDELAKSEFDLKKLLADKDKEIDEIRDGCYQTIEDQREQITVLQEVLRKVNYRLGELEDYEFHEEIERILK